MDFTKSIIIICMPIGIFASMLSIDVSNPYSSGESRVKIKYQDPARWEYDTISFSNGVFLSYCRQSNGIALEGPALADGIKWYSTVDVIKAGVKYKANAKSKNSDSANIDTVWSSATVFPDSLLKFDSLFISTLPPFDTQFIGFGKWLFKTSTDLSFYNTTSSVVDGFNTIMYFKTKKNRMKFQTANIYLSVHPQVWGTGLSDYLVDSLRIVWAVDSLGNGQFKQLTPIKSRGIAPAKPSINKNYRLNSIESLFHSNGEVALFTTSGKRVYTLQSSNSARIPPGVFVYRIGKSGQAQSWGRVLVR